MYKKNIDEYLNGISDIDDDLCDKIYLKYRERTSGKKSLKKFFTRKAFAIPCLIILLCVISIGTYVTVEAKEYQDAIEFFEENELLLDGLTRTEIKKVYKDITTNSFAYELTEKVLINSIQEKVPGYFIESVKLTTEELKSLWEKWDEYFNKLHEGIYYNYRSIYEQIGDEINYNRFLYSEICKYSGEEVIWSVNVDYYILNYDVQNEFILVVGYKRYDIKTYFISLISNEGNILWEQEIGEMPDSLYRVNLLINNDNTYSLVMFTHFDNMLRFHNFDMKGYKNTVTVNLDKLDDSTLGHIKIKTIINYEDGYLVSLLYSNGYIYTPKIIKLNKNGFIEEFIYKIEDDIAYIITDLIEYQDKIYISAYSVNETFITYSSVRGEIYSILEYLYSLGTPIVSDEVMTKKLQEHYKAVLLVCDKNNMELTHFYEVEKSLGNKLNINENNELVWDVHFIKSAVYSPATSSFTIGGELLVYQYIFNEGGVLIEQKNTSEIAIYRR